MQRGLFLLLLCRTRARTAGRDRVNTQANKKHLPVSADRGLGQRRPPPGDLCKALITSLLPLECLMSNLFRGWHYQVPTTQCLFGGQIVGQALMAAAHTVSCKKQVRSLHCYFIQKGDNTVLVLYKVEQTHTSMDVAFRSVKAIQNGTPILTCQASFQTSQSSPEEHGYTMPDVPPPEELMTQEDLCQRFMTAPGLPERHQKHFKKILAEDVLLDVKPTKPQDLFYLELQEPRQLFWVRARGSIGEMDTDVHRCVAAYISHYKFLSTALPLHRQHRIKSMVPLEHSMEFYAPFRADNWMLLECESTWAGECRALVRGRLWRRDRVLAATCEQKGAITVEQTPNEKNPRRPFDSRNKK